MSLPSLLLRWLLPFALLPAQRLKLGQLVCFGVAAALVAAQRLRSAPAEGAASVGPSAAFCVIGGAEALFETCSLALFLRSVAKAVTERTTPRGWMLNALALAFVHSGLVHRCGCEGAGGAAAGGDAAAAAAAAAEVCRAEDAAGVLEAATSSAVLRALAKALTRNYRHACAATCAVTSWTG
jgi:hypothetical protein